MRWSRTLSALMSLTLMIACGGADEAAMDADAMEAEMAAAPAADVAQGSCYVQGATPEEARADRPSPLSETAIAFQGGTGLLCYGAPSANGREIMGALVPYDALWRAGANEPTAIHLTAPASIGGVELEPGSYSIYAMPGASEWTFYVNSNFERWGIPISEEVRTTEVGSFTATPSAIDETVETLRYRWEPNGENTMGDIVMEWANTQVRFHVHPGG